MADSGIDYLGRLWFPHSVFQWDFSGIGLWIVAVAAVAFFGYLLVDGLRHRLRWRRLLKKTQGNQGSE